MSYVRSAIAFWVGLYNATVATLATRTSERDSARNSLYVSGVYLSGQTWQAKDATDLANYNSEVSLYNAEVAQHAADMPASLDHQQATASQTANGTYSNVANVSADRSGQWVVSWRVSVPLVSGAALSFQPYVGGSPVTGASSTSAPFSIGAVWQGFASSGTVFRLDVTGSGGQTMSITTDAYFIPTPANPH